MKKLESLSADKFRKLGTNDLMNIMGGIQDNSGTDLDSFVCTASNPSEGDGMECDENCDFSGVSMSMALFDRMVQTGTVDPKSLREGAYISNHEMNRLIYY